MIACLDSSVLLRLVLGQRGRLKEWKQVREGVVSALGDRELARRREAIYRLLEEIEVVEATRPVISRASQPPPTPLGTLDAIHLATAMLWRESTPADLVFATHDASLGIAARASGFLVVGI